MARSILKWYVEVPCELTLQREHSLLSHPLPGCLDVKLLTVSGCLDVCFLGSGVCMGQATSLRALKLPGAVQFHSAIPALGAAGFLLHTTQQCDRGPARDCGRYARQSLFTLVVTYCMILFTLTRADFGEHQGSRTLGKR